MIIESRLGDLVNIRTGKLDANASSDNGKYPFFTCSIMPLRIDNYSYDCECVLVAGNGDLNVKYYNGKFDAYQRTYIIEVKDKLKVNTKYLYYYMSKYIEVLRNQSIGGVIKYIKLANLTEAKIPIISLDKQIKIIEILDLAQMIIEKRKKSIELLDELVKSKFIEMFGDPYLNPKRWAKKELKEIMLLANNGLSRRGNDLDGNIVLRLVELQDGYLDYTSVNRIKLTESEEKRYLLKDGDFLFARVNGNPDNVGRCAYYQEIGEKVFHNDHIIRVRFDNTLINNCFVSTMLNSGYGKLQMKDKLKTSAGQYTVNQTGISEIKVVVPPIELQNKFEDFVKQVDKLKFEMEHSLKELEDNFNSLMQKAFKGELFN
ncbi:restriction endonuclease subunit S [Clostridium perfringens]